MSATVEVDLTEAELRFRELLGNQRAYAKWAELVRKEWHRRRSNARARHGES